MSTHQATEWGSVAYQHDVIERVWQTAQAIAGNDPALWRKDECGAWIYRLDYGRRHSDFGWEIYDPTVSPIGGTLSVLRPFQWQNFLDHLAASTRSRITSDGLRNTRRLL
jgi:hypothetical protein